MKIAFLLGMIVVLVALALFLAQCARSPQMSGAYASVAASPGAISAPPPESAVLPAASAAAPSPNSRAELAAGDRAPNFALPDQEDRTVRLSDQRGKWVVLYFFPKASTPGCTKESCGFSENIAAFETLEATVLGASADTIEAQKAFAEKYNLDLRLLSDTGLEMLKDYGVVAADAAKDAGVHPKRTTFLIDPEGRIAHIWRDVKVAGHVEEVRARLEELRRSPRAK